MDGSSNRKHTESRELSGPYVVGIAILASCGIHSGEVVQVAAGMLYVVHGLVR